MDEQRNHGQQLIVSVVRGRAPDLLLWAWQAGNYAVRNSDFGIRFLDDWAGFEEELPRSGALPKELSPFASICFLDHVRSMELLQLLNIRWCDANSRLPLL